MPSSVRPEDLQDIIEMHPRWLVCEDRNPFRGNCSVIGWTTNFIACKYCFCVLFGSKLAGVCCGMKTLSGWGDAFRRRQSDTIWEHCSHSNFSTIRNLNEHLVPFLSTNIWHALFERWAPSSVKYYRIFPSFLQANDTINLFLCVTGKPSLHNRDQHATLLQQAGAIEMWKTWFRLCTVVSSLINIVKER